MLKTKLLFIDRDGTLIREPADKQVDCVTKFQLEPHVISALVELQAAGYEFIMVSNQDGLGTSSFPLEKFELVQQLLIDIFDSQGIRFKDILICPHLPQDHCSCRKPRLGLLLDYVADHDWDRRRSYVIGDRATDIELAQQLGIGSFYYGEQYHWLQIADALIRAPRQATQVRQTHETCVRVDVKLDQASTSDIQTGIGFFDHMLEQLAKHSGIGIVCQVQGDLDIDDHHTVEDTALVLGAAIKQALGDKRGIERYGCIVPMDEAQTRVALDLSGRAYTKFSGVFPREKVGELATELVPHFFRSFAEALQATLHMDVYGDNAHHMIESSFKALGRALRQAVMVTSRQCPSTKGVL